MRYLIKLYLEPPNDNLDYVKQLPGLQGIEIDNPYGLVLISPKRNLYTIRVSGDLHPGELLSVQPEVKGVYPETKIGALEPSHHSQQGE